MALRDEVLPPTVNGARKNNADLTPTVDITLSMNIVFRIIISYKIPLP